MRNLAFVLGVVLVAGCLTTSQDQKVQKYIKKNPDTSPEVQKALMDGEVIKGMTMEHVTLTWGKPSTVKAVGVGSGKETIWYYIPEKKDEMSGSKLFAMEVPNKRVTFSEKGVVNGFKLYDEELETARSTALTKTIPKKLLGSKELSADGKPIVRAGSFRGWPYLKLSTIMGKGSNAAAVINGQIKGAGESIGSVKILAVGSLGVKMEYKGQIGILKKGEATK